MSAPAPGRRPPGRLRRWVVRPFVWGLLLSGLVLIGLLVVLQSPFVRHRLAARLAAAVSEKTGRPVQIGAADLSLLPLALELHDVVLPGPAPTDPPVATLPLARVQASWSDLRQRILRLEQVELERPAFNLQIAADGSTNLPRWQTTGRTGPRRFELQIGHVVVQDGTFQLNDRKIPLTVEARAVWGRAVGAADRGGEGGDRLDLQATAQEVVTRLPEAQPWPATLSAKASLFPSERRLRIAAARVAGPGLEGSAGGEIHWLGGKHRVALEIDARGEARLLNRLGYLQEPIEGTFGLRGTVRAEERRITYGGTLTAPRIALQGREVRDLEAELAGGRERLDVEVRRATYAGGTVHGPIRIPYDDGGRPGTPVELDLTFAGLGLQPLLADQFPGEPLPVVGGLAGTVRGTLAYRFDSRAPLAGNGKADLQVAAAHRVGGLPVTGTLPVRIENGVLKSGDLRLSAPGQELAVDAFDFDLNRGKGRVAWRLESRDLGRWTPWLREDAPPGEPWPFWLPNAGQGTLQGEVAIDRAAYDAVIRLDLRNAVTPDLAAATARGSLRLRPDAVEDLQIVLTGAGGDASASLMVSGRVPLALEGEAAPREPLALQVAAQSWPAASVARFLLPAAEGGSRPEIGGRVTGDLALRGFPDTLQGEATAEVADLALADRRIGQARVEVGFDGAAVRLRRLAVQTEAGNVLIAGTFAGGEGADGGGSLDFTVDAPRLALAAPPLRDLFGGTLEGRMAVGGVIGGTLERPEATVRVVGSQLGLEAGGGGTAQALLAWDGDSLRATGSLLGLISFDGGGRLDRSRADLSFDVSSGDLAALARVVAPRKTPQDLGGSALGSLGLTADFAEGAWEGTLRLADLRLRLGTHEIANLEPVEVTLTPDRLFLRSLYLGEAQSDSELFATGTVGLGGSAPLDLRLQSTLAAGWAELFAPGLDVDGAVDLLARVRGTAEAPVLNGQGEIRGGRLVIPNFPHEIKNVRGALRLDRDTIVMEGVHADFGGGTLLAAGRLQIPDPGKPLDARLQVSARDLSLRYPEGFLARGDADLALAAGPGGRILRGDVRLSRLFYLDDVEVGTLDLLRGAFQRRRLEVAATNELMAGTQLNVRVGGTDALRVNNNIADLRGGLDLFVRGTLANPVLFGRVELTPGGRLVYADNDYEVERGLLTFNNPYRIDPVIDLVARTEVRNYDISLSLSGTLERLNAQFSSQEGLADLEILTLLATGQGLEGERVPQAPGERTEADVRASTLLASQAASLVSSRVGTLFGFDRFRIDPQPSPSGGALGGVRLTAGKRISKDLFVTYTTDPASSEEYLVRVEWQVSNRVLLVLTRDGKADTFALDAQWEKRF